jgi:hypothetical protein
LLGGTLLIVMIAIAAGVFAFTSGGGDADCDTAALAAIMRDRIDAAEREGHAESTVTFPDGCGESDMVDVLPEVSRTWHVMPGGTLMHLPEHEGDR